MTEEKLNKILETVSKSSKDIAAASLAVAEVNRELARIASRQSEASSNIEYRSTKSETPLESGSNPTLNGAGNTNTQILQSAKTDLVLKPAHIMAKQAVGILITAVMVATAGYAGTINSSSLITAMENRAENLSRNTEYLLAQIPASDFVSDLLSTLDNSRLGSVSLFKTIISGFQSLKEQVNFAEGEPNIENIEYRISNVETNINNQNPNKEEPKPTQLAQVSQPIQQITQIIQPFNLESLKQELLAEIEARITKAQLVTTIQPVIYQSITRQSDADSNRRSVITTNILESGSFTNPTLTGATITGSTFSGSSATITDLTVTTCTGCGTPFAWTTTSYGVATSTTLGFLNGFLSTASSTLTNFSFTNATGTSATTTNFFSTTASSTNLFSSALTVNGNLFTVNGAPTLNDWFDQSVKIAASPTFAGATLSSDLVFSGNNVIRRNTSDGSDSGEIYLHGGGSSSAAQSQGASVRVTGNENGSLPGFVRIYPGNVVGSKFSVVDSANSFNSLDILGSDGSATFTSSNDDAWTFNSTHGSGPILLAQRSGTSLFQLGSDAVISGGNNYDTTLKSTAAASALRLVAGTNADHAVVLNPGNGAFHPKTDNTLILGVGGNRWSAVWAANATIQTSDLRFKNDFIPSLGLDFVRAINPIGFRRLNDGTDTSRHFGFGAQQVYSVLESFGIIDSWIVHKPIDETTEKWGLSETEMIGPLYQAVKELDLNMQNLAGAASSTTPESESFVSSFFDNLFNKVRTWLADAANGITKLVADIIESKKSTTELLCVKKAGGAEVCVTGEQLESLIANSGSGSTVIYTQSEESSANEGNASTTTEETIVVEKNTATTTQETIVEEEVAEEETATSTEPVTEEQAVVETVEEPVGEEVPAEESEPVSEESP